MHQCIKFILFWNDTIHVSDGLSIRHQQFRTVHTATGICQTDTAVCLLWGISVCTVLNCWRTERLSKTCRGRSTHFRKFDILVHLVGFIIEIILWCTALWTSDLSHIHRYGIQHSISYSTYPLLNVLHIQVRLYFLAIWTKLHFFMLQFHSHNKNTHFVTQNFHQNLMLRNQQTGTFHNSISGNVIPESLGMPLK
jgi:hypothetical protein